MVSENQQTVNSLSRFWVSEQMKRSNRPRYCKLIRGNYVGEIRRVDKGFMVFYRS